jgi:hypothetical protein
MKIEKCKLGAGIANRAGKATNGIFHFSICNLQFRPLGGEGRESAAHLPPPPYVGGFQRW